MPEEGVKDLGHENILTLEEIERIVRTAASLGISKFRLTGGEPLVRKGIIELIKHLKVIPGVRELTMTTNGALLGDMAKDLKAVGLDRVNISLDTLNHTRFKSITRGGDLNDVIAGINAAVDAGLKPIKLNVVVMKEFNEDEIMDFVQMTFQHDYEIRFIELMPIGETAGQCEGGYVSNAQIKSRLPGLRPLSVNVDGEEEETAYGVAELYQYPGTRGKIGFISPMSDCFCPSCNKLRLTADGKLKTCLHSNHEVDLKMALNSEDEGELKKTIEAAVLSKEEKHNLCEGAVPIERNMNKIGG